jgi:hypothetical protein
MSELQVIESALAKAARRRRIERALHGLGGGLLAGGVVLLLAMAAYKLFPIPLTVVSGAGIAAAACALIGFIIGGWRRTSLLEIARWVDERKELKERLSTALEMSGTRAPEEWKHLVLSDAAQHARSLNAKEILPIGLPKVARWALLMLALCAGLGFVPEYRSKAHVKKQQDAAIIKDTGKNLSDLVRRELAQKPPVLPPTQQSMEQVAELGDKLGKQILTKAEALKDLASATQKLAEQEKQLSQNPAMKQLERAAREPGNGATATPESIQKSMEALQKALGEAAGKADKLDKLAKEMQKLQQQAANMASKDSAGGQAAKEQLAQSLADLAKQAREAGASPEGLDEAIKALASNNPDQFIKDLETASHDLEKLRDMAKAMQALQQQAAKMGKDLAEQLQKGQAQAAQQTLQKMIDQLKTANLSKEQLDKIMDEVSKAVDSASQYGKVADYLKEATQQCRSGDKPGAAQNLAEAQKELQKLLDQMADAQSLQASLDALERAQWAIANNKSWSQCQGQCPHCNGWGCEQCKGGKWGHGGRPGRGVGTWSDDENGWTYFPQNRDAGWDNSGIQRPDMEGRGHTDRPDDLNPNLMPDKVKGQMSPGGSMPSITLKGVSIKGTSTVKFEEAAATAQQEAQSALNQDQVPRAYQNHVRDYFDDLKK